MFKRFSLDWQSAKASGEKHASNLKKKIWGGNFRKPDP